MTNAATTLRLMDTHAHFDAFVEEGSVAEIVRRAREAHVLRAIAIGGTPDANTRALQVAAAFPDVLRATIGLDRDEIGKPVDVVLLQQQMRHTQVVAVGETGLDYHYGPATRSEQCALFSQMLELAAEARLPVVVHSREADDDTVALLREYVNRPGVDAARPGVLHCFTGSEIFAHRLLDLGFFISFSGIVTFKNGEPLRAVARTIPADRLLFETDAPYLAPVPNRGKRNEPAWVAHVAAALATERGVPLQEMAEQVWENASRLFAWRE
ncbi:MAG: TatD family hydrolase [Kiritimatiellae bacterium]|nr:TatD family hydrolase [Kiritimatiellia bacterium]